MLPTTAPVNAPERSIPSIPMLMTPERSQSTPLKAPNVIGTDRRTVLCSIPRRLRERSRAAHVRKANTNNSITIPSTRVVRRPNPRVNCTPPRKPQTAAISIDVALLGTTRSGKRKKVSPRAGLSPSRDCRPELEPIPNAIKTRAAIRRKKMPITRARRTEPTGAATVRAEALIRPIPWRTSAGP